MDMDALLMENHTLLSTGTCHCNIDRLKTTRATHNRCSFSTATSMYSKITITDSVTYSL